MPSMSHGLFGGRDLLHTPAQVDRRRAEAVGGFPGNRSLQCVIDFENAGTIPVSRELTFISL